MLLEILINIETEKYTHTLRKYASRQKHIVHMQIAMCLPQKVLLFSICLTISLFYFCASICLFPLPLKNLFTYEYITAHFLFFLFLKIYKNAIARCNIRYCFKGGKIEPQKRWYPHFLTKVIGNGFYSFCLNYVHSWLDFRSACYTLLKLYNHGLVVSFLNLFPWNDRPGKGRLASQMSGLHCSYGNKC